MFRSIRSGQYEGNLFGLPSGCGQMLNYIWLRTQGTIDAPYLTSSAGISRSVRTG